MDADEQDICNYLKQWQKQFISGREICRCAGGKWRFRDDPHWANQPSCGWWKSKYLRLILAATSD